MSAAVFPVVEYRTWKEFVQEAADEFSLRWNGRVSIDLRWVSSCRPSEFSIFRWVTLTLAGSSGEIDIDATYEDFMRDWMKARG